MAKPDHTVSARPDELLGKSTNPLGRPFWTQTIADDTEQSAFATLAGMTMGLSSLARILANSEAYREAQKHNQSVEPGYWPLDAQVTEGLFAALYFLSEQAEVLSHSALDAFAAKPAG
jgi:hypothetical protein